MKLKFDPVNDAVYDTYVVTIRYEHGDADPTTFKTVLLPSVSQRHVIGYIKHLQSIAASIEDSHQDHSIEEDFEDTAIFEKSDIPLELDCTVTGIFDFDYYASMSIESISYFDSGGKHFNVTYEE